MEAFIVLHVSFIALLSVSHLQAVRSVLLAEPEAMGMLGTPCVPQPAARRADRRQTWS